MSTDVDAVIAALRTVLQEAEDREGDYWWNTHIVNRWIDQLPGAWWGRWRRLRLRGDSGDSDAKRDNLITHVRATLAYLEANRDAIASRRLRLPAAPAQSKEVAVKDARGARPKWLN